MLTQMQQIVYEHILNGLDNASIMKEMSISRNALKKHKQKIKRKIGDFSDTNKEKVKDPDKFLQEQVAFYRKELEAHKSLSSMEERVITLFQESIVRYKHANIELKERKPSKGRQEECVLLLSDWHAGEEVTQDETMGMGEYNLDVLQKRVQNIYDASDSILTKMSGYSYEKLHIMLLGDMVSGIIHQELIQGTAVVDQVIFCAELIANLIKNLAPHFPVIEVDGVVGNHGRMTVKPSFKNRHNNFDYLMYKYLEIKFENCPNIKFNIPKSPFILKKIQNWNFLLMHGDGIKGFAGIPYYGMRRMDSQMSQVLVDKKGIYPHYICLGHFHDSNQLSKIGGKIIMNGSLKGADGYSLGKMFTASEPRQLLFSVHPDKGMTWNFNLCLDTP